MKRIRYFVLFAMLFGAACTGLRPAGQARLPGTSAGECAMHIARAHMALAGPADAPAAAIRAATHAAAMADYHACLARAVT